MVWRNFSENGMYSGTCKLKLSAHCINELKQRAPFPCANKSAISCSRRTVPVSFTSVDKEGYEQVYFNEVSMEEEAALGDFIGIDIGTTSIKCCVLDIRKKIRSEKSVVHNAWVKNGSNLHREQDPVKILNVLQNLLKSMEVKLSSKVAVSITGQMHGIVLWNGQDLAKGEFNCSPLITWMDERVPVKFLESLPRWDCGDLHIGYGMVTLAWLYSSGQFNSAWTCCGTIMDMIISYLYNLPKHLLAFKMRIVGVTAPLVDSGL
ncbi:Sedoheptulokinase [Dirofilaria immitis]|nr:Sedoheptulokinase [Dirofilaria immitis]